MLILSNVCKKLHDILQRCTDSARFAIRLVINYIYVSILLMRNILLLQNSHFLFQTFAQKSFKITE